MEHIHSSTTPTHFHKDKVTQLLKTASGQIEGIIKMYEDNRYCVDISKQILSVLSMLKKANALILNDHINSCVVEALSENNGKEKIDEITDIIQKYLK